MMEIAASSLAPMRRHAPKPDEADKTVMGASCTGSYEVTDVPPGDVQGRGHPGRSTNLQQDSKASVSPRVRPTGGPRPPTPSLSVREAGEGEPEVAVRIGPPVSHPQSCRGQLGLDPLAA